MDQRAVARMVAMARIGIGVVLLAAPTTVGRPWVGEPARTPGARLVLRTLGGRDLVLGLGALRALGEGDGSAEGWVRAGAAADAGDAAAGLIGLRGLPSPARWGVIASAATAAAVGWNAAGDLG